MTPAEIRAIVDHACVKVAAGPDPFCRNSRLDPRLWDALRMEMQRRFRRATGEPYVVLSIDISPDPREEKP